MSIRVLLVGPSLDILGGQAVQLARLLERLREEPGFQFDFLPVNPRLPGPLAALQRIKYVRTVATMASYAGALALTVPRYDIVHAFSASYWSFLLAPVPAMAAAKLFGSKSVLNYRSGEAEDHFANWSSAARFTRFADRIVVPSGYLVDVFGRFGFEAHAIPNFVDVSRFRFRERAAPAPRFLSNRNFEPLYNVACTLRAFALVQRACPEASLTLVGDGSQREALQSLAAHLELGNVEFTGQVPNARMVDLYAAADIYLNTPDIDNMPGSIVEAFACGIPVVTTNAGGIPYVVTHERTGLMTERDAHEAIAAQALRLLREPGLALRLTTEARAECERRYTWPAVRDRWIALYRELAKRHQQERSVR
jgi:L-malate glycosyltransferase